MPSLSKSLAPALSKNRVLARITLRGITSQVSRFLLTLVAVVLGTAFIAASAMFSHSLQASFQQVVSSQFDDLDWVGTSAEGITPSQAAAMAALPGVEHATLSSPPATMVIAYEGKRISSGGAPSMALIAPIPGATLDAGRWPQGPEECVLNSPTLASAGIPIDAAITTVSTSGSRVCRVVGAYSMPSDTGAWIGVGLDQETYLDIFGIQSSDSVESRATQVSIKGTNPTLVSQFPDIYFRPASELAAETSATIDQGLRFLRYFLWAFAGISLVVGGFIISNTFAMIVAARGRQFALLRSIGMSSRDIVRSVLVESFLVGVVGSVLGIIAGMGIASLINFVLSHFRTGLPDQSLVLMPSDMLVPLVAGTLITVISAAGPALAAGRVPPVAALRVSDTSRGLHTRTLYGITLLFAGVSLTLGCWWLAAHTKWLVITLGVGVLALLAGWWCVGPAFAVTVTSRLGRVFGRPFGMVGRLAAGAAERSPRRAASTAFALTLGLFIVTLIGTLGASMKASVADTMESDMTADYVAVSASPSMPMAADLPTRFQAVPGVTKVASVYFSPILVNDTSLSASPAFAGARVIGGNFGAMVDLKVLAGQVPEGSTPGVILSATAAKRLRVSAGDLVSLSRAARLGMVHDPSTDASPVRVPVAAVYEDTLTVSEGAITLAAAAQVVPEQQLRLVGVLIKGTASQEALREVVRDELVIDVLTRKEYQGSLADSVTGMLNILYALLSLAIIVAALGIINTLALGVIERRKEIGMLRAVGLTRGNIRAMINIEAVTLSVAGAIVGTIFGLGSGAVFVHILAREGLESYAIPSSLAVTATVAAGVVGVIAALGPAAKAANTPPLAAIAD